MLSTFVGYIYRSMLRFVVLPVRLLHDDDDDDDDGGGGGAGCSVCGCSTGRSR